MEETYLLNHPGVKKKILHGGQGPLPHFPNGTKLVFHFQTLLDNFERTVIDDSRKNKQPTEIFVGKMFKMEVWEVLLTSMRIGEVAEFWCDAIHTGLYPIVSKGMRLVAQGKDPLEGQKHMCGMGNVFTYHSTGFPELDELMREPQPLIFIMELISVGDRFSYKRESWLMDKDEKMQAVPSLHFEGNALVQQGCYCEAAEKYKEAVLLLRVVQSREMPGDEDYIKLGKLMIPLVLNYCQCMLELEEYYEVIEHTSELIEKHKDCVKAYYKRAKAYAAVWSEKEAKRDFLMVANLDVTLSRLVQKELKLLSERMKEKYWEDREKYWNMLEEKEKKKEEKENEEEREGDSPGETNGGGEKDPGEESECSQQEVREEGVGEISEEPKSEAERRVAALIEGKDRQQMLRLIMLLQDEGSFHIKERRFSEAMVKFEEALEYVDYLQTKEVDYKGEDWESLENVRLPLTLNLSQCRFELGEYQAVVDLNSKLLKNHRDNLKAVYQRARAHAALYNEEKARRDFARAERLDPKLKPVVMQELKKLGEKLRAKHAREKKNYWDSSKERWQQKGSKAGQKKEVKWADEGIATCQSLPAGEDGQKEKTKNSLDKEEMSSPALREGKEDADNEPRDEERDLPRAEVVADNPDGGIKGSGRDIEVKEVSLTATLDNAVQNKAASPDSGNLKTVDVQEDAAGAAEEQGSRAGPGAAGEPGSSAGPGAAGEPPSSAGPGAAEEQGSSAGPGAAEEQGSSAGPGPAEEPESRAGPGATEEQGSSAGPGAAEEPGSSAGPGAAEEPGSSAGPGAAEEPGSSAGPGAAEEQGSSAGPGAAEEPGSSAGPGAAAGGKPRQQSKGSGCHKTEKSKVSSGCRAQNTNTVQKPRPKDASTTAITSSAKPASKNCKGRPTKKK